MERGGAVYLLIPAMQDAELWQKSVRWYSNGSQLIRMTDRNAREFALGATLDEVITDLVRDEVKSYTKLPLTLYQFQTKIRDEQRP
ncbi:aminoacyl--tRNA ligase-related protein, partial [Bacillus thuringiensis]|uniref:aminoacyl--tRNA ligase-related protein n=1 Tax=Bacillus thuringiensis TaxID=1428 RepID=UPI00284DB43B